MSHHHVRRPGMDFRRFWLAPVVVALSVVTAGPAAAGQPSAGRRAVSPLGITRPSHIEGNDSDRRIDINNLNMWVTNYGSFAWDILTGNSGLVYPKGTTKTAVFASGLWLGASVGPGAGTETRIALAEYSQEYGAGKMGAGALDNPEPAASKVY